MGITEAERRAYEAMETSFQKYVCRRHTPIRDLYQDISAGSLRVADRFLRRCCRFILIVEMAIRKKIPGFSR
ncbi:MAG: hypothetical protein ACLR6B_16270 [Blautia sp.]